MRFAPLLVVFIFSACAIPVPLLDPGSRQLAEPDKDVIFPSAGSDQPSPSLNAATILALSIESPLPSLGSDSRLIAESDKAVLPHDSISPFSGLEPEKRSPQPIDPSLHLTADTTVLSHSIESSDSRVKRAIDEPSSEKDAAASLGAEIVLPPMATEPTHSLEIVHHTANETVVDLETALALDPPLEIGILPTDDVNESIAPEIAHSVEIGTPLLSPNVSDATAAPETAHSLDSTFESVTTPVNNETDERNDSTLATLSNETAPALPVTTPASELGIRALLPLLPDLLNLIPVQNSSFDSFWKQSKINFANNTARVMEELTRLPFDRNVVTSVDGQAVDARLRKRVEEMADQFKEGFLVAGPERNVEEIYVLAATYFCSDCATVYSLEAIYNISEASHNDHRGSENEFGNITSGYTCGAFHRVSGVRLVRHQKGMSDVELDMSKINKALSLLTSQFGVARADRQASWKKPEDNITLVPTYNAARLPEFGAYPKIRTLLNEVVSLKRVRRLHNRCSHFKNAEHDDHFFSSVCYEDEKDTVRSFYASSASGEEEDKWAHSAIDLKEVIHELLDDPNAGGDVPPTTVARQAIELLRPEQSYRHDTPSFWEIDEARSRVFRQQFLSPESTDDGHRGYSKYFARAHDRSDIFLKRAKVAVVQEHLTDRDGYNVKVRAYLDCDLFENAEYREYASLPWWKKYLNPINWFQYWRKDCGVAELETERKKLMHE
ncbi:hypothetical protein PRIPAC_97361 [Pristionchus pacificus]|uniref:Uncharacterized protein n=1 Tax=Pristionchus pacificus TaxID=54126 RepID=A0A2A6B3B0_PRIPA|nr:hypothetical protein PRIPAC_97361 [Pristionchus pacificus]|eukprot:PDM60364.1 hypothetical protein PRIPAC_54189 [Pristionchus pacificus]